jgi:hypothetical protein
MNSIRKLGIKMPEIANTLIDGEFLEDKNIFMFFDVYFFFQVLIREDCILIRKQIISLEHYLF